MRRIISLTLIILLFAFSTKAEEDKEGFYEQISRAVIRLEHIEQIKKEGSNIIKTKNISDGTAFFVASEKDLYLVSARHVVDKNHALHARVRCKNEVTKEIEVILLKVQKDRWIFHNVTGDNNTNYVDVAVQKIEWIKDRTIKAFRFESKESKNFEINQLPYEDPLPPRSILSFGFPMDIGFKLLEQRPFGRSGIIAMVTGKEFLKLANGKFAEERDVILDLDMFPGNSGSPVINKMDISDPKPKLLGLIVATNLKMNYAIMEPVSRIIETLDLAKGQSKENVNFWFLINTPLTNQSTGPDSAAGVAPSGL